MKNIKYSIVIPHINEGYLLDITLDSIYNKFKYDKFEIIIVDDGSNNLSDLDFVKEHPLEDKINIYFKKNLGSSNARNYGAEKSSGDFLIFLDSHMYFKDDFLTDLNDLLIKNKKIDLLQPIIGNIKDKKVKGTIYKIKDFLLNSTWDSIKNKINKNIINTPNIAGGATIIKRKVFKDLDGFNKNFIKWGCEDLEFSMRAWLSGYKCFFTTSIFVAHYFKESFKNTVVTSENVVNNRIMFAYTCFQNKSRFKKVLDEIKNHYGEKLFNEIHEKILENKEFGKWVKKQKKNYKHNDDWYFEKFKDYYFDFNKLINEKL